MAAAATESSKLDQQVDLSTIPISPGDKEGPANAPASDDKPVTVFHDKDNFNVKHPLQNKWTLWFTKPPSGKVPFAPRPRTHSSSSWHPRATIGMICSRKLSRSTLLRNFGEFT